MHPRSPLHSTSFHRALLPPSPRPHLGPPHPHPPPPSLSLPLLSFLLFFFPFPLPTQLKSNFDELNAVLANGFNKDDLLVYQSQWNCFVVHFSLNPLHLEEERKIVVFPCYRRLRYQFQIRCGHLCVSLHFPPLLSANWSREIGVKSNLIRFLPSTLFGIKLFIPILFLPPHLVFLLMKEANKSNRDLIS